MKFMVMLRSEQQCEAGPAGDELVAAMARYNHALVRAGILQVAEELHPSARGARVEWSGGKRTVVLGPFAEPSRLVASFWVWQVASLREAIDWAKRCPLAGKANVQVEIRQLYDFEDFGTANERDGAANERDLEACGEPLVAA